jgi:beta-phosphoglucomutase
MIRGIVFDLDGVLMDSSGCHRDSFVEVLRDYGVTDFEYAPYAGWRTPEVFESVFRRAGLPASADVIEEASRRKSGLAREKLTASNPVAKNCVPVLEWLAKRYALALASSGSRAGVEWFLDANGCRRFFRSVLTGSDVERAKPSPEIYERSFQALGLDAAECAVVEDAVSGVKAGRAAGGMVIGISGTFAPEALMEAGASCVVGSLDDLLELRL